MVPYPGKGLPYPYTFMNEFPLEAWRRFEEIWKEVRSEWDDSVRREVEQRWIDHWEPRIRRLDEAMREAELFSRLPD